MARGTTPSNRNDKERARTSGKREMTRGTSHSKGRSLLPESASCARTWSDQGRATARRNYYSPKGNTVWKNAKGTRGSDSKSEKTTRLVSIVKNLFSPYNILVRSNEIIWDDNFEIDSNEYEWVSCSNVTEDIEVDTIHSYTPLSQEGQGSESPPLEFGPWHIYKASEKGQWKYEQGYIEDNTIKDLDNIIDLTSIPNNYSDAYIMTLTMNNLNPPNDSLPLIYPDLIDKEEPEHHDVLIFPDDESIV